MADQILSQEEIAALLSAMDKGEVELEGSKDNGLKVAPFDLTSHNITLGEHFEMLDDINDRFVKLLRTSLASSLRKQLEVTAVSNELMKFQDFIKEFSYPTSFNLFTMEPLYGAALLVIDPAFAFSVIDCLLGGPGKALDQVREFTLIEERVIRKFINLVLKDMERAWQFVYGIKPFLKKTEVKPKFVQLVPPTDLVIVSVLAVNGNDFGGRLHLCIPYLMLEPIQENLTYKNLLEMVANHACESQLKELVSETQVAITAQLGKTVHTVRDIVNLQLGDIIKLTIGPQDPITVAVEDIPKYHAVPGIVRGNRAVRITALLDHNGGAK